MAAQFRGRSHVRGPGSKHRFPPCKGGRGLSPRHAQGSGSPHPHRVPEAKSHTVRRVGARVVPMCLRRRFSVRAGCVGAASPPHPARGSRERLTTPVVL